MPAFRRRICSSALNAVEIDAQQTKGDEQAPREQASSRDTRRMGRRLTQWPTNKAGLRKGTVIRCAVSQGEAWT
jgi:hypothetical protein